jgi:hypothetical protein
MAQPARALAIRRPGMTSDQEAAEALPQYRLGQILATWAAAVLPMAVLGW